MKTKRGGLNDTRRKRLKRTEMRSTYGASKSDYYPKTNFMLESIIINAMLLNHIPLFVTSFSVLTATVVYVKCREMGEQLIKTPARQFIWFHCVSVVDWNKRKRTHSQYDQIWVELFIRDK